MSTHRCISSIFRNKSYKPRKQSPCWENRYVYSFNTSQTINPDELCTTFKGHQRQWSFEDFTNLSVITFWFPESPLCLQPVWHGSVAKHIHTFTATKSFLCHLLKLLPNHVRTIQQSSNRAQRDSISSTGQIILDFLCRILNNGNGVGTGNAGTQTVNSIVIVASCGSPDIPSVNTGLSGYRWEHLTLHYPAI